VSKNAANCEERAGSSKKSDGTERGGTLGLDGDEGGEEGGGEGGEEGGEEGGDSDDAMKIDELDFKLIEFELAGGVIRRRDSIRSRDKRVVEAEGQPLVGATPKASSKVRPCPPLRGTIAEALSRMEE
jgi:hypothetical protein